MPSVEPVNKARIKGLMKETHIPGLSIAYISSDGIATTDTFGSMAGFGFFKMSKNPTLVPFDEITLADKDALILFNNEFFYADQKTKTVVKAAATEAQQADASLLKSKFTDAYQQADNDELQLIKTITGLTIPSPVTPETVSRVASLSKPVFAYLVQKLITANAAGNAELGTGQFVLPDDLTHFDLDTPLSKILPLAELKKPQFGVF